MNKSAAVALFCFRFKTCDGNGTLGPACHHGFVGAKPGAPDQTGNKTNLPELTRESENGSQLTPGFRACETIDNVSETIDLDKRQSICGYITFHCDPLRASQDKK